MPNIAINLNTSGDQPLVAGQAGKIIRVLGYVITGPGGTQNVTFKDGTTALTGPLPVSATGGGVAPVTNQGWFDTTPGNALNLNLSASTQVSGHLTYTILG